MKFLRNLIASILGTLLALLIIFMLLISTASLVGDSERVVVKNNSVLELKLDKKVKDYAPKSDDPLEEILGLNSDKISLNNIINAIENAKTDENIKGISIATLNINAGFAQTQVIRNKLEDFKESGKFIYAYADIYNQKSYYLSSVADSVFINPVGAVDFKGLSGEILYYKDLQDKTGVKMDVIRHGKYKSAVEPFLANKMSNENREQISSLLKSVWDVLLNEMANSRSISVEKLNNIADNALGRKATLAVENKLIDQAIYLDEYSSKMKVVMGVDIDSELKKVSMKDYISSGKGRLKSSGTDRIAVVYAQGEIIYGKGDENFIGQDLIINALRKARKTKSTKAIVLRINSPGGSALASELIWRELELTSEQLPVVVSMGNVAASGGYYIACNADKIYAQPTTITGSIGVYGTIPNMSELAGNIGVNAEQVSTNSGPNYSVFEPMTDEFRAVTKEGVEQVYTTFLERVSKGRGMLIEEVDKIAQGRVWSGVEAKEVGLVDELGNLDDAISYAAELAKLTDFRIRNYPSYKIDLEDRLNKFPFGKAKEQILKEELGEENFQIYTNLKHISNKKGVQARMPFILEIK